MVYGIMYPVAKYQFSPSQKRLCGAIHPLLIAHRYLKPAIELTVHRRNWIGWPKRGENSSEARSFAVTACQRN